MNVFRKSGRMRLVAGIVAAGCLGLPGVAMAKNLELTVTNATDGTLTVTKATENIHATVGDTIAENASATYDVTHFHGVGEGHIDFKASACSIGIKVHYYYNGASKHCHEMTVEPDGGGDPECGFEKTADEAHACAVTIDISNP